MPSTPFAWLTHVYDRVPAHRRPARRRPVGPAAPGRGLPEPGLAMRLLHALDVRPTARVLERGTGSGTQTRCSPSLSCIRISSSLTALLSTARSSPPPRTRRSPQRPRSSSRVARTKRGGFECVLVGHTVDHIPAAWLRHTNRARCSWPPLTGGLDIGHPLLLCRGPACRTGSQRPQAHVQL
jgi:hypothetical protein